MELEPNNEAGQANALQTVPCSFSTCQNGGGPGPSGVCHATCGAISSASDVDFLTFTLQPATTKMQVKFDGKVTLGISVDGMNVTLGAGGNQSVPFVQDKPYSVEVKPLESKGTPNWAVCLVEQ